MKELFRTLTPERDGHRGTVHVHYLPDRDEHGKVRGCIVLVTDITERKRQEEALRASDVTPHISTAFTFYMRCIILFSASQRHRA